MRPGASASETPFTAATPPKRLTAPSISRIGATRFKRLGSDGPGEVVLLLQHAQDAAGHQEYDPHDDGPEQELVQVDEAGPHRLLEEEQHGGAQHRSPDRAL